MAQLGVQDMLRTQLLLGMNNYGGNSGWGSVRNIIFLNLYDKIIANFPTWYPSLKSFCFFEIKLFNFPSSKKKLTVSAKKLLIDKGYKLFLNWNDGL